MFRGVADTHTALWYMFGDLRLSMPAKRFIDETAAVPGKIAIPSICLVEIIYLVEKQRIPATAFEDIQEALRDPDHVFEEIMLHSRVVRNLKQIPRQSVPDMPDRIIAATALYLDVPLVSRDGKIRTSNVTTIW